MQTPIRVAVVDPVGVKAGMDYYSQNLLCGFHGKNVECYLFSNTVPQADDDYKTISVFVAFSKTIIGKVVNLLVGYTQAAYQCRKHNVDVVILHVFAANMGTFFGFAINKLFGNKVLAIVHDVSSFAGDDSDYVAGKIYGPFADWLAVHNKVSFESFQEKLKSYGISKNIYVAEHGAFVRQVDKTVTRQSARQSLGLDPDAVYGLFFGQIKKTKKLDDLISAWGVAKPSAKLIIAGKPWKQTFDSYQTLIEESELSDSMVTLTRYINDDEREMLFKAADFSVLPYSEIYQSGVLLMAMSYGLPVIATDIPGFSSVVGAENCGLLFEKGNVEDLAEKINQLVDTPGLRKELGENAIHAVNTKYEWGSIAGVHLENLGLIEKTEAPAVIV